jgi:hypothetical protein
LLLLASGMPVLYAVAFHPALYDAVRHFLFIIPLICILAALGARELFAWCVGCIHNRPMRNAVAVVLCLIVLYSGATQIYVMARLHPYEYIYANSFTGGVRGAFGHYESDYWGTSFKEAAEKLQAYVTKEGGVPAGKIYKIAICGPWTSATIYLPPNYKPVIANRPAEFFLSTTRWQCQNMRPGREIVRIQRLGAPLAIIKDLRGGYQYYEGNRNLLPKPPVTTP